MMKWLVTAALLLGLAACDGRGIGSAPVPPDEFAVEPKKPLVMPADTSILPEPGGSNLADYDPDALAQRALGG